MADIELAGLRKECMTSLYLCADNVAKHLENEKDEEFAKLKRYAEGYSFLESQQKLAEDAVEKAKADTDLSNIDAIDEKFQDYLRTLMFRHYKPSTHTYVLELNKRIAKANNHSQVPASINDSDLTIMESQEHFIDPITKKPIQDPVKNSVCGHVYERESILQLISLKNRTRCPVAGCGNRSPITEDQLMSDEELNFRAAVNKHSTMVEHHSILNLDCTT